ncbi:shikimate kinase [Candidatus Oleimmundimicrobium sp.]|uniref:shikimate kinase n=1 Tax=Candidatus Oleimmundimicrobium sp. TaxID=3060597 RepID=UPI0027263F50|nr:shikimate kinase [Candidatus Oleimmundimicrobium sp.]MDO8886510.1 shikimate kinase [Candidatus Oleimmundimicrobium sp.]
MKNIVLIGFMGSGKTTIGKLLADKLGVSLIDTDKLIEKKFGKQIKDIFKDEGEDAFRLVESEVINEVSSVGNKVIACGGGVILNHKNVQALKKNGLLIYLKASAPILFERIREEGSRPLLNVPNPKDKVSELLKARESLYENVADIVIDTSDMNVDKVVKEIQEKLNE